MRVVRYRDLSGRVHHGRVREGGGVQRLEGAWGQWRDSGTDAEVAAFLAPVQPPAIFCIGLNYRDHAAELGCPTVPQWPVVFMKSPGAVVGDGEAIVLPRGLVPCERVDYEAELAVVIGRDCRDVPVARALDVVLGWMCANDVSAREWQWERGGGQYCRAKTFDTFCPLGPSIVTRESLPDPQALKIETRVGGEVLQCSSTAQMIFTVAELVSFLSGGTTLRAGTVILTGTPGGVGMGRQPPRWLRPGEVVEVEIEGVGVLRNPVVEEEVREVSP